MGPVSVVDWSFMNFVLRPWQLFFLILCGWVNRHQQEVIEFQNAQIQALMDKMGRKRILLSDEDAPPFMLASSPSQDHSALVWHDCPAFLVRAASPITSSQIRPRTQSC
jgi:hypothetical protein